MTRPTLCAAALAVAALLPVAGASAAALEGEQFYLGGGVSDNEIGASDAGGFQFFLGYELPLDTDALGVAVELGYWEAGDFDRQTPSGRRSFDVDGIWLNGVASVPLSPRFDLIGRVGLDFGDDSGLMAGAGLGFDLDPSFQLRGEVIERDDTESLQLNLLYRF
ncbi:MAG: outer membrane beta-barrel protein [Halofilum sp. (in: g-proteobacteria)]|nr:outer membrane beta-barrel protein [Halofilum sp. (in: g-proteobacteria)]